jgi:hypothetical protein
LEFAALKLIAFEPVSVFSIVFTPCIDAIGVVSAPLDVVYTPKGLVVRDMFPVMLGNPALILEPAVLLPLSQ